MELDPNDFTQKELDTIWMIMDKLENGEASQIGDLECSDKVWDAVRRLRKK